jgi:hypothetical protein
LRLLIALIGASAILMSLLVMARPALAGEQGEIAVFKTMCDSIGQQDTRNGRDTSLDGWHIDFTVQPVIEDVPGAVVQTIVITLGENDQDGGNVGGGSMGRNTGDPLATGEYLVCEIPTAYNDEDPPDEVPLSVLPRPDASGGGSTGGSQHQVGDCIQLTLGTGTEEVKFLDQQLVPPAEPTLVIDKVASTETINIVGGVATPSIVTWTLSYTLTNGPVDLAVITDVVPAGFTFLDAANGGTFASGTVTWDLGTISSSGSVSFRTTVNASTIATGTTTNTAVIDSEDTAPDDGQDSVTVTRQGTAGGNPTPTPAAVPNTAMAIDGQVPAAALSLLLLGSLAALAYLRLARQR